MPEYNDRFSEWVEMWNVVAFMALIGAISFPISILLLIDRYGENWRSLWKYFLSLFGRSIH